MNKLPQDLHIHTTFSRHDGAVAPEQTVELVAAVAHAQVVGISDHLESIADDFEVYAETVRFYGFVVGTEVNGADWVAEAEAVARPKAMYRPSFIESKGDDTIVVDGVTLTSRVLRVNVEDTHRVFPYVATCGVEVEEWSQSSGDLLRSYWLDSIKEEAVRAASRTLRKHLAEHYRAGRMAAMAPGSLGDWPIQQQKRLFAILGDPERTIGVRLSASCLMSPVKSVSGILFPTEISFESCQLCPRAECPGRRAPYESDLYDRKYRLAEVGAA